ncbi:hypothetical protein GCM10023144_30330 [Pigmentiphaga soli]|uniref:STAS/SEC14 domain-containing protein n=1 Tax=Pigmentiphaga soli TaxID=1007095 RepID=A0ABP8H9T5_9BURK
MPCWPAISERGPYAHTCWDVSKTCWSRWNAAKTWLQANAGRIRAQVIGIATVVPAEHLDRMSRMDAEKLFGVPARTFDDVDRALSWVSETMGRAA